MNLKIHRLRSLLILVIVISGVLLLKAQNTVTFQVDMTDTEITDGKVIGIRGNMAPLSWFSTLPLEDPNKDGIYTTTITFDEGHFGKRVMYKYMLGKTWDLDHYGGFGNRVLTLSNCPIELPIDVWNKLNSFSYEFKLMDWNNENGNLWIYMISKGKEQGKSPEDITMEYLNFWAGDYSWITTPQMIMHMEEFDQSKYPNGFFEEIHNSPSKVSFKAGKVWIDFINNRSGNGEYMGVTADDLESTMKTFYMEVAKHKGWILDWKDKEDITLISIEIK